MEYLKKSFSVNVSGNRTKMNIMSNEDRKRLGMPLDEDLPGGARGDKLVDRTGAPTVLKTYQKNGLYSKAKKLRSEISEGLCGKEECSSPTDKNVNKMIHSEFRLNPKIEEYKKCMKAIGADPRDYDVNRLRRR